MIRYTAYFKDNSQYSLYSQDYFFDKAIFWRVHQTNLIGFSEAVASKGRPHKVFDEYTKEEFLFTIEAEFDKWYKTHQSAEPDFGFTNLDSAETKIMNSYSQEEIIEEGLQKIEIAIDFIESEIKYLVNERSFDHWRIDGGYKELEKNIRTSIASLERIKENQTLPLDIIEKLNSVFRIPLSPMRNGNDLISYSKKSDKIEHKVLIELLKENLALIHSEKKELMHVIKKDKYGSWWKFWK